MMKMTKQMLASLTAVSTAASAVASLAMLPAFAAAHAAAPDPQPTAQRASGTWSFHAENVLGTSLDMAVAAPSRKRRACR